ncbi:MAG: P-loop NTPase [Crenarchaeota archaeon]|nr:P-loop NTPase [Thermoproteota archaeon]
MARSFKIIVAGKGGVGKTTVSAGLAVLLARRGYRVVALDTDSVPNLALSLGVPLEEASRITPLVENVELVEERTGARPGGGWGLLFTLTPRVDDILEKYGVTTRDGVRLVVVGGITKPGEGCLCPSIALAKAFIAHVFANEEAVVIVDSEAGAEVFGRGLAEYFDLMIAVAEPTVRSLSIARRLIELARGLDVKRFAVVINKVRDELAAKKLYERVMRGLDYPVFTIPYDPVLEEYESRGLSVADLPDDSELFLALTSLVSYIESLIKGG